jgi:hypothetical protein
MPYPYINQPINNYPQIQAYQAPIQQPAYQGGILWGTYEEACAYPLAPNAAVTIWDRNQKVVYWKQSDAAGRQTMQILDYTIRGEAKEPERPELEPVTKGDIAPIMDRIAGIEALLRGGKTDE